MPNLNKRKAISPKIRFIVITTFLLVLLCFGVYFYKMENKTITLHYAAWNLGDAQNPLMERKMIEEYEKNNPNIKIIIEESFVENYDLAMTEAAKAQTIPDVFMYSGNATVESNDWCLDLTNIVKKDDEWNKIQSVLTDATYMKGKVVAIPSAIYLYGYYCNEEVVLGSGLKLLDQPIELETFIAYCKQTTNLSEGRIGLGDASSIPEWYPASVNPRLGWFSWDGGKLNLNSEEFMEGIDLAKLFMTKKYTFGMLNEQEKASMQAEGDWQAWSEGKVAFKFDGTWSMSNYAEISEKISFVGMPGGRTCIVPDFLFLSKNTSHPEEAYEFAKYMSAYSEKGFQTRIQLAKENDFEVTSLPMIEDTDITEDYFSFIHMKGIEEAYRNFMEHPKDAYVEATKVLPGYPMARWNYMTNFKVMDKEHATIGEVITACTRGELDYREVADEINYLANSSILMYPQQLNN